MNPFKKLEEYAKQGLYKAREIIALLKEIRDLLQRWNDWNGVER